tara:strand:- start:453 stop:1151 length:699 start_codon:yes stop_codon:yes gene_type:complete
MKIGIVQPYLFPYIGYFQLIHSVDKFVVLDDVNFAKKKWVNRNQILIAGQPSFITVPLKKVSQNKLILEIEIAKDQKWRKKILSSIQSAYGRAPMFNQVYSIVEKTLNQNHTHISKLASASLFAVSQYLKIETQFVQSSSLYKNSHLKSQNRILDICQKENASEYLNPIGGTELYSRDEFEAHGIKLYFIKPEPGNYNQFEFDFVPFLSIIDVLMFNPIKTVQKLLNQCKFI